MKVKVYNFKCDRCQKELTGDTKITIFAKEHKSENPKKKYDLCHKCYTAMEKGIQKKKGQVESNE